MQIKYPLINCSDIGFYIHQGKAAIDQLEADYPHDRNVLRIKDSLEYLQNAMVCINVSSGYKGIPPMSHGRYDHSWQTD